MPALVRGRLRHRRRRLPPAWADEPPSPVQQTYNLVVPDVLARIYSMKEPVPVPQLAESVWQGARPGFDLDHVSSFILEGLRARTDRDVEHIFDAFEALGAVTSVRAMADEIQHELITPQHHDLRALGCLTVAQQDQPSRPQTHPLGFLSCRALSWARQRWNRDQRMRPERF